MLSLLSLQLVQWYQKAIAIQATNSDQLLALHLARTLISRDIQQASISPKAWKLISEKQLVMHTAVRHMSKHSYDHASGSGNSGSVVGVVSMSEIGVSEANDQRKKEDVGWLFDTGSLYRITGIYNEHRNRWDKKNKQCVMRNLEGCLFQVTRGVTIIVTLNGRTEQWFMCPREGMIITV